MESSPRETPQLLDALRRHFGLQAFRPGQHDIVGSVLSGRNTVVVMPTGAGKSLCYQLPAMLLDGVTLVVSPLIALMQDQVDALVARGIPATFINSTLADGERLARQRALREGAFKLVYVAPERLRSEAFLDALAAARLALYAIDEAHCISQWGHDFRPDYALLGQVRKRLRPPRTVALTATATPEVRDDIVRVLLLKEPRTFVAGFDRPNLFLEVKQVSGDADKRDAAAALVEEGGSGLVYCSTRRQAEMLHESLARRHRRTVLYHAGLADDARRAAQDAFMAHADAVAVATNAFGMGIDKPDIRFVAHAGIPRAVEAYYQEIGRAGRDGLPAHAVLLFNHADVFTQERLIEGSYPDDALLERLWELLRSEGADERNATALARRTGTSEFEVSSALRLFERERLVARAGRGGGRGGGASAELACLRDGPWSELGVELGRWRSQERQQRLLLRRMVDYAYARTCRRGFVLRYFGDAARALRRCGGCDVCEGPRLHGRPRLAVTAVPPRVVRRGLKPARGRGADAPRAQGSSRSPRARR